MFSRASRIAIFFISTEGLLLIVPLHAANRASSPAQAARTYLITGSTPVLIDAGVGQLKSHLDAIAARPRQPCPCVRDARSRTMPPARRPSPRAGRYPFLEVSGRRRFEIPGHVDAALG